MRSAAPSSSNELGWNSAKQGGFVTSLCRDLQGSLWAGTEDNGVSRYNPDTNQWTQFTATDGLGDDDIYSLIVDLRGRVWAGTGRHGVSVFNGKIWKTYDQVTGPLGAHVTALAISPIDGAVWGGTEAGLFRYANNAWTYITRADGLPSDQITALAFDKSGTLYVGTDCDGVAIGTVADGYKTWRTITGPDKMPDTPSGLGLPSNLVNALLIAQDGTIYVGTDGGLAWSRDNGVSWRYVRGADYLDKLKRASPPRKPGKSDAVGGVTADLLSEDYVTALAQDADGHILVGHRQTGLEALDAATGKRVSLTAEGVTATDDVFALLPVNPGVLVGRYSGGLVQIGSQETTKTPPVTTAATPFPTPASPPRLASLSAMTQQVQGHHDELPVGGAVYLGEDWATQGDWVGRYGRQFALLCAMQAPLDHDLSCWNMAYKVHGQIGPHSTSDDSLRRWVNTVKTSDPKCLYDPLIGYRREAEWDDHGETYPISYDGPNIWVDVTVPRGYYRVSLYFVNKDGHKTADRFRDYHIELMPLKESLQEAESSPTLAHARIHNFWGGCYKQFLVYGAGKYYLKISRNSSQNTILCGVFIDKLTGPDNRFDEKQSIWLGGVDYAPSSIGTDAAPKKASSVEQAAQAVWSSLDATNDVTSLPLQEPYRILAYRAALSANAASSLLDGWRWKLGIWEPKDRQEFQQAMAQSYAALTGSFPILLTTKR